MANSKDNTDPENISKIKLINIRAATFLSIAVVVGYFFLTIALVSQAELILFLSDVVTPIISFIVILALLKTIQILKKHQSPAFTPWLFLTLAQIFFFIGDVIWGYLEITLQIEPFPSIADIFYIIYYPLFAIGIFMLPRLSPNTWKNSRFILDMGIIVTATFMFFWSFLILPTFEISTGDNSGLFISILYIILDFVLLFPLLDLIFNRIKNLQDKVLLLLAGSIAAQIFTDIFFALQTISGTFVSGTPMETGWILGYILLGLAGIIQSNRVISGDSEIPKVTDAHKFSYNTYLPYLLVFASFLLLIGGYENYSTMNLIFLEVGVGFTILMVVIRQILSLKENQTLYFNAQEEIKKRKKIEQKLKSERDRAQSYFNISGVILLVLDSEGYVKLINKKGCQVLGYEKEEIIGKNWFNTFVAFNQREEVKTIFETLMKKQEYYTDHHSETGIIDKQGEERIIAWHNTILKDDEDNLVGTLSSGEEITLRKIREKRAKEKTAQTIERQEILLQLTREDAIDITNAFKTLVEKDSHILDVERVSIWFFNEDKSEMICQYLYQKDLKTPDKSLVLKAEDYPLYFQAIKSSHNIAAYDAHSDPKTSEFAEFYLKPLGITSMLDVPIWLRGELFGVLCHEHVGEEKRRWSFEDQDFAVAIANLISRYLESNQRQMAENKIKKSLDEKEILLREIHHRVKNNMQIISSLLNLQSNYLNDEKIKDVFKESQNRVRSMSMVHEMLYNSPDLDNIQLRDYMQKLTNTLINSYSTPNKRIKLFIQIEDIQMGIDTAIPLGLVINELISNSLKHAFKDLKEGKIRITAESKGGDYLIMVTDNGIGFPPDINFYKTKSLGLQLVNTLVDQIDGEIKLKTIKGQCTSFRIRFKELKYKNRI